MHVADMLDRKGNQVYAVRPEWSVRETAAMIAERNIGTTLVTDGEGSLIGIISERDLVRALSDIGEGLLELRVGDLMTRSVITCTPETSVSDALSLMASHHIRHLPVVRNNEILGLISVRDVLEFRLEGLEENFAALIRARRQSARTQKAAELSRQAQHQFLLSVSHRLKPSLGAILDLGEELAHSNPSDVNADEFSRNIRAIEHHAFDGIAMLDDLLDLSRLALKEIEPADDTVFLGELLPTCVAAVAEMAEARGVRVHVGETGAAAAATTAAADATGMSALMADRRMMPLMLINLLTNAIRFTPAGGTVAVDCAVDKAGCVRLSVVDSGVGIAPEHLAKVVEPFYQAGAATVHSQGAGLGLALVDAMIEAHGGALKLQSKVGIGTTAMLRFPATRTIVSPQHQPSPPAAAEAAA